MNKFRNFSARLFYKVFGERNDVQILSMHIPKTAGSSFKNTLKKQYGSKLGLMYGRKTPPENRGYKVLHGHFYLKNMRPCFPEARVITWVRNPIDRLVSLYYFWKKSPENLGPLQQKVVNGEITLVEFAKEKGIQNEMTLYFSGASIDDFTFIGVVENFEQDLSLLSEKLSWQNLQMFQRNVNPSKMSVSDVEYDTLKLTLKEDIDLYNRIVEHRQLHHLIIA